MRCSNKETKRAELHKVLNLSAKLIHIPFNKALVVVGAVKVYDKNRVRAGPYMRSPVRIAFLPHFFAFAGAKSHRRLSVVRCDRTSTHSFFSIFGAILVRFFPGAIPASLTGSLSDTRARRSVALRASLRLALPR